MNISVLVPTYRRPKDLARCLEALQQQTRLADQVLVVVRDSDTETWAFLQDFSPNDLPLHTVKVSVAGQVAALNAGLNAAQGEIIAITDDDAAPHKNWLERIEANFQANNLVGGVGGRDWLYLNGKLQDATVHPGASQTIGKVQWFGRTIGNHHLGEGEPREVEILKGANMSYRRAAIGELRFDERLGGTGAQVYNDMAFSLALKQSGWTLIYDPSVAVDHYLAQRFDEDQRHKFNKTAVVNQGHNETLILLEYLPPIRRAVFLMWTIFIGTRTNLGLMQCLRFLPTEGILAVQKWLASVQGRWQGWQRWRQSSRTLAPRPTTCVYTGDAK